MLPPLPHDVAKRIQFGHVFNGEILRDLGTSLDTHDGQVSQRTRVGREADRNHVRGD